MATCQTLIDETRRYLLPTARESLNTLSGAHTNSQTTFTFGHDITAIQPGSMLSIDLEIVYVWSVTAGGTTAVVQRGMQGTTAASHNDGALVRVDTRFPDFAIFQAINADLDDLSSTLFQVPASLTFTFKPQINGYDLTGIGANFRDILRVRYDIPGPWKTWPEIRHWQIKRAMVTSDFSSGVALILYEPGWPGRRILVTYAAPFTHFGNATDDITSVAGLAASMADIPPLGAAARLSGVREVQRNQFESQSDPRRATEVPPNSQIAGATQLLRLREMRIKEESYKLYQQYPRRRHP